MGRHARACLSLLLALLALTGCASLRLSLPARVPVEQHGRLGETVTLERYAVTLHQVQYPATIAGLNLGLVYSLATMTPTRNEQRPRAGYRWVTFDVTVTASGSAANLMVLATLRLGDGSKLTPSFTPRQPGLGALSPDRPSRGWLTFEVPNGVLMQRLAISVPGDATPGPTGEIVFDLS